MTALVAATLTGAGPATAATHQDVARIARAGPAGTISTVAGGVGGPGRATTVGLSAGGGFDICGVSFGGGHVYVGARGTVREVTPGTDQLTTPAGTGSTAPFGDRGPGQKAGLNVCGTAVDHSGNLVLGDTAHHRVRVVAARTGTFYGTHMSAGHIYTVAGTGAAGSSGDGGPATKAELRNPFGVAVDPAGNLLISDGPAQRVRIVAEQGGTFYGQAMTAGDIYTVAGDGVHGFAGDGGPGTSAELNGPAGVAVDAAGNVLIADRDNNRIRVVAATTGTFYGQAMTTGDIYTIAGKGRAGFSGDGGPAATAELDFPQAVAVDGAGNVLIADTGNQRVRVVAATTGTFYGVSMTAGDIYTVAGTGAGGFSGDGGPATSAELSFPEGVAVDTAGNLLISDEDNVRIRVIAATTGTFYGQKMTAGDIYTGAGNGDSSFSGDRGLATRAELGEPGTAAVDGAGNLLVADTDNLRIRVVAAKTGTFYGQKMTAGHVYTVAGGGTGALGDGGPATRALIVFPQSVTLDPAGNVLITDTVQDRIRVVADSTGTFYGVSMTAGDIYTIAGTGKLGFSGDGGPATQAEVGLPDGVTVDGAGNVLIADTNNERIRVIAATTGTFYGQKMTAGDIYTIAGGSYGFSGDGGPATEAKVALPEGVAVDGAGNVLIADTQNSRIRVVAATTGTFYGVSMTAGDIYTVAGGGSAGLGDGGPATSAELSAPDAAAADTAGNLVIADTSNNRIRVVAASTGTFYGVSMTAGDIYTVAGNGKSGFSGDGGPATSGCVSDPEGVTVNAAGDLVIADSGNNRIRLVTR
jgi:sugar lactone lactonase YvrE